MLSSRAWSPVSQLIHLPQLTVPTLLVHVPNEPSVYDII